MVWRKENITTLGGAKMQKHFECGNCGARFDFPIIRFDNGLKVCPACLSFITEDALSLVSKKIQWFKKSRLKNDDWEELSNRIFPVDTKFIIEDCVKED